MNLKQHVAPEVLHALANDQLSDATLDGVRTHLSSCTACRDREADVVVERSLRELRQLDDQTVNDSAHLDEGLLRQFWRGDLRDQKELRRISAHCVACLNCREKRKRIWIEAKSEAGQFTVALSLLATRAKRISHLRRRRFRRLAILLVFMAVPTGILLIRREWPGTANQHTPHGVASVSPTPESAPTTAVTTPSPGNAPLTAAKRLDQSRVGKRGSSSDELLTQAQEINLQDRGMGDVRGASDDDGYKKAPVEIIPCRDRDTVIRIELPENNLTGRYVVSIKEPANLQTLVVGHAFSFNGKDVRISLNLRTMPSSDYVMSLTREDKTNGTDLVGNFDIRLVEPAIEEKRITK